MFLKNLTFAESIVLPVYFSLVPNVKSAEFLTLSNCARKDRVNHRFMDSIRNNKWRDFGCQAKNNEERVCLIYRHCLWRDFQTIRKQAGLLRWKDTRKVMRRNCETDWAQKYPQYAVSNWIGHGIDVSARHYL